MAHSLDDSPLAAIEERIPKRSKATVDEIGEAIDSVARATMLAVGEKYKVLRSVAVAVPRIVSTHRLGRSKRKGPEAVLSQLRRRLAGADHPGEQRQLRRPRRDALRRRQAPRGLLLSPGRRAHRPRHRGRRQAAARRERGGRRDRPASLSLVGDGDAQPRGAGALPGIGGAHRALRPGLAGDRRSAALLRQGALRLGRGRLDRRRSPGSTATRRISAASSPPVSACSIPG